MINASLILIIFLSYLEITFNAPTTACVKVTVVSGKGEMDGKYVLKEHVGEKPNEVCIDGCIYFKDDNLEDEYCFKTVEEADAAFVQCEVNLDYKNSKYTCLEHR